MTDEGVALRADGVTVSFGGRQIVSDVSLSIRSRSVVAVCGPSGCGKSTLLHVLSGLILPDAGRVIARGVDVGLQNVAERAAFRLKHFGFVFQSGELLPEFTLLDNVQLPLRLLGLPGRQAERRALSMLERLGLAESVNRRPGEVSGGQLQRAAIARAVVHRPNIVFADEPTGALDHANGVSVLNLLVNIAHDLGAAVFIVTHDATAAARADHVVSLLDGSVVA